MLFQLTMFPTAQRGASVSAEVARVIDIIDKSGLPYRMTSMATLIEGSWDEVMKLVNKARLALRRRCSRVYIVIHVDDRKGSRRRLTGKIQSIERQLGREISK